MLRDMGAIGARLIESRDLVERVRWFNHPAIYENMPLDTPVSLGGTQAWYSRVVSNSSRKDYAFTRLDERGVESDLVAMGGLVSIDHRHRRCELYIAVNPFMTGQGIGHAVVRWMCDQAFYRIGVHRVFLYTIADNEGANRFYKRLGFAKEGVLRDHQVHLGRLVDRCVFGILRAEWEKHRGEGGGVEVVEIAG